MPFFVLKHNTTSGISEEEDLGPKGENGKQHLDQPDAEKTSKPFLSGVGRGSPQQWDA